MNKLAFFGWDACPRIEGNPMKLMPIKQAQAKLANTTVDKGLASITLHTFKKDRSLTLRREGDGWLLDERGFEESSTLLAFRFGREAHAEGSVQARVPAQHQGLRGRDRGPDRAKRELPPAKGRNAAAMPSRTRPRPRLFAR